MQEQTFQYDVFLSHSSKDKPIVRELATQLENDGFKVWLDEWAIQPGDPISIKIEEGLELSRVLILCMSENAFDSDWVSLERHTILFRDPTNKDRRFVPLLIGDCEIPLLLRQYAYLNWTDKNDTVYEKLVDTLEASEKKEQKIAEQKTKKEKYLLATLKGHTDSIYESIFTPDGKKLVSCSTDEMIKVWDLKTNENIVTMKGHTDIIMGCAISPDGEKIVSASEDYTLKIWNLKTGIEIATLKGHTRGIFKCAFFADGNRIVSGSRDTTIKIWDLASGKNITTLKGHTKSVNSCRITPDEKKIVSCSEDGTIKVWDIETGEHVSTLKGHTEAVWDCPISPNGEKIVSCSEDGTIKIWNIKTGKNIATLEGHTKFIYGCLISPDGTKIISCSSDGIIKVWDLETGKNIFTIEQNTIGIWGCSISPDGKKLATCLTDASIKIWDVSSLLSDGKSTDVQYTNAKIALVGESGVGKTGLAIRLTENDWRATESTHGMSILPLELPNTQEEEKDKEVWLWDFAGQPDYRLIHQLYMEETSLAMLVIDPQKEDPLTPLSHWESALSKAVDTNPSKLLVAARCDRGGITISNDKLQNYCDTHSYSSFHFTEAKTGKGCDELKEVLANTIPWDDLPWTTTSQVFHKLKTAILKIKEEGSVLLRFDSLKQRLQLDLVDTSLQTQDIRAVVGLLEGQGIVKRLDFGDWILLQPEQINNYASAIIREIRNNTEEIGHINKEDVLNGQIDFHDLKRLDTAIEKELLRAIVQTFIDRNICLQEDTVHGRQLVFPSYFKVERPELLDAPNVFITYTFTGVLDEIYATLIVRLIHTNDFEKDRFWKYAADFKTHSGKRLGLQMIKNKENAELKVYFETDIPDDTKVSFIKYIHEHLNKHTKDVQRVRSYVCPDCSEPIEKNRVAKRIQKGKKDIICDECDFKFPFTDIIEQKFGSDRFDRKVEEMDKKAEFSIDNESKELILVGHAYTTVATGGHIFRITSNSDWGVDGEIEFKDKEGNASGKKVYVQLKSGGSYLKKRKRDEKEIFYIKNDRLIKYWQSHNYPIMLVIRDAEDQIRWMNITEYLKKHTSKTKIIEFEGDHFTPLSVDNLRKQLYPTI